MQMLKLKRDLARAWYVCTYMYMCTHFQVRTHPQLTVEYVYRIPLLGPSHYHTCPSCRIDRIAHSKCLPPSHVKHNQARFVRNVCTAVHWAALGLHCCLHTMQVGVVQGRGVSSLLDPLIGRSSPHMDGKYMSCVGGHTGLSSLLDPLIGQA